MEAKSSTQTAEIERFLNLMFANCVYNFTDVSSRF